MPDDGNTMLQMDNPGRRAELREFAKRILELRVNEVTQQRIDALADKCTEGSLDEDERGEYESFVSFFNLLTVLQTKAQTILKD